MLYGEPLEEALDAFSLICQVIEANQSNPGTAFGHFSLKCFWLGLDFSLQCEEE